MLDLKFFSVLCRPLFDLLSFLGHYIARSSVSITALNIPLIFINCLYDSM